MDMDRVYLALQKRFRPRRMREFYRLFGIGRSTRVLDVGGTMLNWSFVAPEPRLTILNVSRPPAGVPRQARWVVGDARAMPIVDKGYDVAFSNSVIEHVGGWKEQEKFAQEIRRVARRYFVQTPNYWFPIEPHVIAPLIHYLPRRIGRWSIVFTLRYLLTRDKGTTLQIFDEVRLLTPGEMRRLFPDAEICFERFLGIRKSILAVKL